MTTHVWLVRHGESLLNALGRVQGWADAPLTPRGIAQAEQRGRDFAAAGVSFEVAISADGVRHRETLRAIARGCAMADDVPLIEHVGWRELCFGPLEGARTRRLQRLLTRHRSADDPLSEALDDLASPSSTMTLPHGGAAERPATVVARAQAALDDAARLATGGSALVVTSGLTMALLVEALGGDLTHMTGGPPHLSLSLLTQGRDGWTVDAAIVDTVRAARPSGG